MSRYDGLIIPRSYSEYINKTDAATLLQALQLSGVMDNAPTANSNHPTKSGGVYTAINNISKVKYITQRSATNIDTLLTDGGNVYFQLCDATSAGTKPDNIISCVVQTILWSISSYGIQILNEIDSGARQYVRYYDNGTWSAWDRILRNSSIKYKDVTYGNVTIQSGNFIELQTGITNARIIGHDLRAWTSNTGAFSIDVYGGTIGYLIGNSGTVVNGLKVRWYYIDV